ncbi:hypothetical protein Aduo_018338 [Ancylostoma duodenale]
MMELSNDPIANEVDGLVWKVRMKLHRGVVDMDAQKAMFYLPRWNSANSESRFCEMSYRRDTIRMTPSMDRR